MPTKQRDFRETLHKIRKSFLFSLSLWLAFVLGVIVGRTQDFGTGMNFIVLGFAVSIFATFAHMHLIAPASDEGFD